MPDFSLLPCARLRSLQLEGCSIRRATDQQLQPGILQTASELQELSLVRCRTDDTSTLLRSLPASLQQLTIEGTLPYGSRFEVVSAPWPGQSAALPASFLQDISRRCRPGLTSLALHSNILSSSLEHLSDLTTLESLSLAGPTAEHEQLEPAALRGIYSLHGLTCLALHNTSPLPAAQVWPWMHLTTLLRLELVHAGSAAELAALGKLTQLQHLAVEDMASLEALLEVLPQLQQLTHLDISQSLQDHPEAAKFYDLTASRNLRCLRHAFPHQSYLDAQVWDYPFLLGRPVLAQLTCLQADSSFPLPLHKVVRRCPNLQQLRFSVCASHTDAQEPGQHPITALQQLQHLTSLELVNKHHLMFSGSSVSTALSKLTVLRRLHISNVTVAPPGDLVSLAALQQLTSLQVERVAHSCHAANGAADAAAAVTTSCQLPASGLLRFTSQVN
jgi:hypothetical protein